MLNGRPVTSATMARISTISSAAKSWASGDWYASEISWITPVPASLQRAGERDQLVGG